MKGLILYFVFLCNMLSFSTEPIINNGFERIAINDHFSYLYQQDKTSEITVLHLLIKGGKLSVNANKRGTALIATRLAVELDSFESLQKLMQMGSIISTEIQGDYITITIKCLSKYFNETVKGLSKSIKHPLLSGLRIGNYKDHMVLGQKSIEDIPEALMENSLWDAFSKNREYSHGGSVFGDEQSRKSIKRKDITNFHRRFFNAAHMVMCTVSDLDKNRISTIISKYFGDIPEGEMPEIPVFEGFIPEHRDLFLQKDNKQVLIAFGTLLPKINRENYVSIYVLENLIGKGIGSKLWSLRSMEDLSYNINSRFVQLKDAGLLMVYLKTNNSKRNIAIESLRKVLKGLYQDGINKNELIISKTRSCADFLRNCETKEQRAIQTAYFEVMNLGYHFLEEFFDEVDKLTVENLNQYIKLVLNPNRFIELTIGDESQPVSSIQ